MNTGKLYIEIERADLQLLEVAIQERSKTWKRTRYYQQMYEENKSFEGVFVEGDIEESNSLYEAQKMLGVWEVFNREILHQISL